MRLLGYFITGKTGVTMKDGFLKNHEFYSKFIVALFTWVIMVPLFMSYYFLSWPFVWLNRLREYLDGKLEIYR